MVNSLRITQKDIYYLDEKKWICVNYIIFIIVVKFFSKFILAIDTLWLFYLNHIARKINKTIYD